MHPHAGLDGYLDRVQELRSLAATYVEKLVGTGRVSVFHSGCLEYHIVADMLEAAARKRDDRVLLTTQPFEAFARHRLTPR